MAAGKGDEITYYSSGGLFKDCELHKVKPVSCEIENMDAVSLNYRLTKFVINNGSRERTVYGDAHDKRYGKLSTLCLLICMVIEVAN